MVYDIDIWWPLLEFGALFNIKVLQCYLNSLLHFGQLILAPPSAGCALFPSVFTWVFGLIVEICALTPQ